MANGIIDIKNQGKPSGIIRGAVDPTIGAGIAAPIGYMFELTIAPGGIWYKTGSGNTEWIKLADKTLSIEAQENIPAFSIVTSNGYIASSANTSHNGKVAGITIEGANTGFIAKVISFGEAINLAWTFTPGDELFLNGTSLSTVVPTTGFRQIIGKAITSTKICVEISEGILL